MLGHVEVRRSNFSSARTLLGEALALDGELGHKVGLALAIESFARLAGHEGDGPTALTLFGAAERLRSEINFPPSPAELAAFDDWFGMSRMASTDEEVEQYLARGRAMTMEDALSMASDNGQ
jgi:hypothetical protein